MAVFTGTLMIIGTTSFLDNVLLVRGSDPATATSFLQNRGLGPGDPAVITGTSVMIHTTPAIEVQDAARAAAGMMMVAAAAAARPRKRGAKKAATKKRTAKKSVAKRSRKEPRS